MYDDILSFCRKKNVESNSIQSDDDVKIEAMKNVLWAIDSNLKSLGSSLAAFPTMPQDISDSILRYSPKSSSDHSEKSREELAKLAGSHIHALNAEQREIFDKIVASVTIPLSRRRTNLYFISCTQISYNSISYMGIRRKILCAFSFRQYLSDTIDGPGGTGKFGRRL
jgi:hypothetical protein